MTFKDWCVEFLDSRGMFSSEAAEVVALLMAAPVMAPMQGRWDEDVAGYPPAMIVTISVPLNAIALKYIDEHQPQAWYRPLFAKAAVP